MSEVDDKPFKCSVKGCNESFTNNDHLEVHLSRHASALKIQCASHGGINTPISALPDQTPTPSKFLRAFEEAGLDEALNPFDATFAKAANDRVDGNNSMAASAVLATMKMRDASQHDIAAALTSLSQQPSPVPISPTGVASLLPSKSIKPPKDNFISRTTVSATTFVTQPTSTTGSKSSTSQATTATTKVVTAQLSQQSNGNGASSITVVSAKERLQHSLRVKAIKTNASSAKYKDTVQLAKAETLTSSTKVTKSIVESSKITSTNDTATTKKSEIPVNGPPRTKRPRRSHEDLDPEEKRQRFLERNRAAATRCREKKKVWINDLDKKVKDLSEKNGQLQAEAVKLRSEVAHLKSLLIAYENGTVPRKDRSSGDAETAASSALTHLAMAPSTDIKSNGNARIK